MAGRPRKRNKVSKVTLADLFIENLTEKVRDARNRGAGEWMIAGMFHPERIEALRRGEPVGVWAWEIGRGGGPESLLWTLWPDGTVGQV